MSQNVKLSKRTETKRKWEVWLKEYEGPIKYLRCVLIWQRHIDFAVLFVAVSLIIWFLLSVEMTVVTMLSLGIVAWVIGGWLASTMNFNISWHSLVPAEDPSTNQDHFTAVVAHLVNIKFAFTDAWEDIQRFRATSHARFVMQVTVVGLVVAWIGSFIPGYVLAILLVYFLLFLPGVLHNAVHHRAAAAAAPHIAVVRAKAEEHIRTAMTQARQRINQVQARTQSQPNFEQPEPQPQTQSQSPSSEEEKEEPQSHDEDHTKAE
jgi:hypothetical protein